MKYWKKIAALVLAAAVCASAAGCSGSDKSWAVKNGTATVPIGSYIYYLYSAYQAADSQKTDSSKSVLDQKIENKDAKTWIREQALTYTKQLLLLDQKMKDRKLTLSAAEQKSMKSMNDSGWSQASAQMEKFGVAQPSFEAAYGGAFYKEKKIFDATYGKGGTKAVSDEELRNYYTKNYVDFAFIACPLYTTNAQGEYVATYSAAQKKSAEKPLNDYAAQIKAGKMTVRQAADAYKKVLKSSDDPLHSATVNLATDTTYPAALKTALKSMKNGEVKTLELSDAQSYLLVVKNDVAKGADAKIKSADERESLLTSYKSDEFTTALQKEVDAMSGVTVNDGAINSYDPKMFAS
ncbi:MAG: peptidylprolyl isomerase [Oscillospiraceae bacterium]|jgi:hypothetical protein|nr:peptidylprolyl isomerase [Oscillospiraceae bacterium]MCI1990314.1 peptidylprolyl isomerase [Oscillospiraceae bacterium]MCI2034593.1 peptidylprolyl isomerase [Oscillospiraceae bacterium]